MASYPLLVVPNEFQSPSGEEGQIILDGIAMEITLMHGSVDDEADWHIDIDPDPRVWQVLGNHIRSMGLNIKNRDVAVIRSELMVLDRHRNFMFDEKFDSADFDLPLRLSKQGSDHVAWDLGLFAADNQGDNHSFNHHSKLISDGGRVYLQGPFVHDNAHGTKIEIHPLDSMAFAMNKAGKTLSIRFGSPSWPRKFVKWRVAFFTNSTFHRINNEAYLKKERTTTWFLDLPSGARVNNTGENRFGINPPQSLGLKVQATSRELWNGSNGEIYFERGVKSLSNWKLAVDPKDGRTKIKITAIMDRPDKFGGIMVIDYAISWNPLVFVDN